METSVAAPAQSASSVDTLQRRTLEVVAPGTLAEEPGGSSKVCLEGPGGSSGHPSQSSCALCEGNFLESELQDRTIRSQRLRVCAHPKVLPKRNASSSEAGERTRRARDPGGPGGPPGKRSRRF
eukprot:3773959-Amphidinium_carterae.1